MKILIVDDSPEALAVANARLSQENLEIVCSDGGRSALEAARREKPDLILLDVDMPEMSGFEVCRVLKNDPELCLIPVLFLSGSASSEDKVKGLDLGAVDYVLKPFDAFELRARVRAALRTKYLQDLLITHAHIDPLTGLPNRRALIARLHQEWSRLQRHGGVLAFIMADIDHFKTINDTYGHHFGDLLLQHVSGAIAGQCRQVDLPARYGGEEFAIIVPEEPAGRAARLAERCRQEIENIAIRAKHQSVQVTASFGVADSTAGNSAELLAQRADAALYRAKSAGRNQVHCDAGQQEPALGALT